MPLGTEVGFGPGYIVLDGAEPPNFWPTSVVAKQLDGLRCHLVTEIGLGPGHIVPDGDTAPPLQRGTASSTIFGPCRLWPNGWID